MSDRPERLAKLPDAYVECRALGHEWTTELGYGYRDRAGIIQRSSAWIRQACSRCGMTAERHYTPWFGIAEPARYTPPAGYVLTGAGRGDWRAEARAELFARRAPARPRRRRGE